MSSTASRARPASDVDEFMVLAVPPEQAADTLADYLGFIALVNIPGALQAVPRDPEDNAVLECAVVANARFVITGDLDLLTIGTFCGIEIVRSAEFMRRWQTGEIKQ